MTYLAVSTIREDSWIRSRVAACVALEGEKENPVGWAMAHDWDLATQPGWADAWDSALSSNSEEGYEPGKDPAVITDAMILSAVQGLMGQVE